MKPFVSRGPSGLPVALGPGGLRAAPQHPHARLHPADGGERPLRLGYEVLLKGGVRLAAPAPLLPGPSGAAVPDESTVRATPPTSTTSATPGKERG